MKNMLDHISRLWTKLIDAIIQSTPPGKINLSKLAIAIATFCLWVPCVGWKFALLIMIAVGWHESGHLWAMSRVGIPHRGFVFVPFFGGIAIAMGLPRSLHDKVLVSVMGPVSGMLLAFTTWIVYMLTLNPVIGVLAYWQAMFNLFNLLPIKPLDGGQIASALGASVSRHAPKVISIVSVVLSVLIAVLLRAPIAMMLVFLTSVELVTVFSGRAPIEHLPKLDRSQLWQSIGVYAGTAILLLFMMTTSVSAGIRLLELLMQ